MGGEFQVNTYTASSQYDPSVTALADGSFVVTWMSDGQDGSEYGIYAQRFTPNDSIPVGSLALTGTAGDDTLTVGEGVGLVEGLEGHDVLDASATTQGVMPDGGAGDDTLWGGSGDDLFLASSGTDAIDGGSHGAEGDAVSFHFAGGGVILDLTAGSASWIDGEIPHTTTLLNIENIKGSLFADTLTGDAGDNMIGGGAGNDVLNGKGGNDFLFGGEGNDVILFVRGEGSDTVKGGAGTDTLKLFDSGGDPEQLDHAMERRPHGGHGHGRGPDGLDAHPDRCGHHRCQRQRRPCLWHGRRGGVRRWREPGHVR